MGEKVLMKGAEVVGEAAIKAGCRLFFGYPITPQNEAPGYMSKRLPEVGGVFLQAESEVAAINMLYGASGSGHRVMTSSSSPGISLMMEALSYIAGAELPVVIVNVMRGGPGLGGIGPAQGDYFQSVKGGGHGDYRCVTLAPDNLQEQVDLMYDAFDIADRYRNPVMLLTDGLLGQIMEAVEFKREKKIEDIPLKPWAANGRKGRSKNLINSFILDFGGLEQHNINIQKKYQEIKNNEIRYESYLTEDAEIALVAYGTMARICKTSVDRLRKEGYKVGLFRPITLWPFPEKQISDLINQPLLKSLAVFELSAGQMLEDIQLYTRQVKPIHFHGRMGGCIPSPEEVIQKVTSLFKEVK